MADTNFPISVPRHDRIVVVGLNYWPEDSGSAPYTTGFAEDLAAHGATVTALVGMPHYPQWRIRREYSGRLRVRETRGGVQVVHSWLWVPPRQSAFQRALWEASFLATTLTVRGIQRPQAVVASTPSLSGAIAARLLARRWRVPYGLVVQDLVGPGAAQSGIPQGSAVAGIARRAEGWALRGASAVAIVSEAFQPYLSSLGVAAGRVQVISNWVQVPAASSERARVRETYGWGPDEVVVLHAGAMGPKQGLEHVVEAARIASVRAPQVRFVLAGDGSQRTALRSRAPSTLQFLPPLSAEAYADLLAAADILLLSQRPGVKDMSLPSKLTSYLAAGRPIVAAVPLGGAAATEVERSGAGVVVPAGDASALIDALVGLAADSEAMGRYARAGMAYAQAVLGRDRALAELRMMVAALGQPRGVS